MNKTKFELKKNRKYKLEVARNRAKPVEYVGTYQGQAPSPTTKQDCYLFSPCRPEGWTMLYVGTESLISAEEL